MLRSRSRHWILATALVAAVWTQSVPAHRMDHVVTAAEAQVVTLSYPFGAPPVFETYRVYAPESEVAFQTGRTDRLGRVTFAPDQPGLWRLQIATEDGHGTEILVRVDDRLSATRVEASNAQRWPMTLAGVGYVLGLAGGFALWRQRRWNRT